jgi:hypothetical protein
VYYSKLSLRNLALRAIAVSYSELLLLILLLSSMFIYLLVINAVHVVTVNILYNDAFRKISFIISLLFHFVEKKFVLPNIIVSP